MRVNLAQILRVIRARWYVVLPAALATLTATIVTFVVTPVTYQSQSTICLLDTTIRTTPTTTTGENPFLSFSSSLSATADFLARSLTSDATAQELATQGVSENFTATLATNAQGPFITLTLTGEDPTHVLQSTRTLTAYAGTKLREIQVLSGVPQSSLIKMAVIVPPQQPHQLLKNKLELVILIAAAGAVVSFMLTFLVENLAQAKRRRERGRRPQPGVGPGLAPEMRSSDETAVLVLPSFDDATINHGRIAGKGYEFTVVARPQQTDRGDGS